MKTAMEAFRSGWKKIKSGPSNIELRAEIKALNCIIKTAERQNRVCKYCGVCGICKELSCECDPTDCDCYHDKSKEVMI